MTAAEETAEPSPEVIEPDLPIVDSHHHLWIHAGRRYLIDEYQADLASGHKVLASVFVECDAMYRRSGPEALRPVGEAEFAAGMAAMSESGHFGPARICAGIIGAANLALGDDVDEVLDALELATGGRLCGIRGTANWDADPCTIAPDMRRAPRGLLQDMHVRAGLARVAARGLVYDSLQFHPQLPEVASLADAFPDLPMVVNHCGGLLGIGPYTGPEAFARWKALVADVARRPNVLMKLGGLSARRCGFGFHERTVPATAQELARLWRPYIETCIEAFGPARCMFGSNFPVDSVAGSYRTVWNALKLTASGCSAAEKGDLFSGTARRVYAVD